MLTFRLMMFRRLFYPLQSKADAKLCARCSGVFQIGRLALLFCWLALLFCWLALPLDALEVSGIFSSGMVLQEGVPVPVWGWADPGETVHVGFAGQEHSVTSSADGSWRVKLRALTTSSQGQSLTVKTGQQSKVFEDVLVGEVWLCAGQSNMAMQVSKSANPEVEMASANDPLLRYFAISGNLPREIPSGPMVREFPKFGQDLKWKSISPAAVSELSAVGYFFARELRVKLKKPIGLVVVARSGTIAETWVRAEVLNSDPVFSKFASRSQSWHDQNATHYRTKVAEARRAWREKCDDAIKNGQPKLLQPKDDPSLDPNLWASVGFNTMISPIVGYAVRGVIWYQGEYNGSGEGGCAQGQDYQRLLTLLIGDWRKIWELDKMYFFIVQLANFGGGTVGNLDSSGWVEVREAQAKVAQSVPDSGLAVTIDLGETKRIHPLNKQDVGRRLSFIALSKTYGQSVACFGPVFKSLTIENGEARLAFDHASGLKVKAGKPSAFALAGADRKFFLANASCEGETVKVSSLNVPKPVAVRYAWTQDPLASLYNGADLPASPFRSDDWPELSWPSGPPK